MEEKYNLYIEVNQIKDERKSKALAKKIAEMGCLDDQGRIIVQRVEKEIQPRTQNPAQQPALGKPGVADKLSSKKDQKLLDQANLLVRSANNELNFTNYDQSFRQLCEAIKLLENSA